MLWQVYIATGRIAADGEHEVEKHLLEVPNTSSMGDSRTAIIAAAKHFKVKEDLILCIPAKGKQGGTKP